jgi:hypothetical protein
MAGPSRRSRATPPTGGLQSPRGRPSLLPIANGGLSSIRQLQADGPTKPQSFIQAIHATFIADTGKVAILSDLAVVLSSRFAP